MIIEHNSWRSHFGKSCLALFLGGVKDLDFEMTLEIQKNRYDNTLMHSVIAIQKQERGITKKCSAYKKQSNKLTFVCEDNDLYLDKDRTFKRNRHQGDKDKKPCRYKLSYYIQRKIPSCAAKGTEITRCQG